MFDKEIDTIDAFLEIKKKEKKLSKLKYKKKMNWPKGGGRNIVLMDDVGLEMGSPRTGSVSFMLWTDDLSKIKDGRLRLVGEDLPQLYKKSQKNEVKEVVFGKVLLLGVHGFDQENTYERYRQIEATRFDLDVKGYMMKAASQYQREWSRVSHEAAKNKLSFAHLGSDLLNRYRQLEYVDAAELVFLTSSLEDVEQLQETAGRVGRIISAMNKMLEEMDFDCGSCEYVDVCDEVDELSKMRDSYETKQ